MSGDICRAIGCAVGGVAIGIAVPAFVIGADLYAAGVWAEWTALAVGALFALGFTCLYIAIPSGGTA